MDTDGTRTRAVREWRFHAGAALGLLLLAASVAEASRIRPVPLRERSRLSERIVVGRVTGVRVGAHPRYSRVVVTHITLCVREAWKGPTSETLSFMQFGDASARSRPAPDGERFRRPRIPGLPSYAVGEEILLFLHRPSEAGLTSPVGGAAGKIRLRRETQAGAPGVGEASLEQGSETTRGPVLSLRAARARVQASLREEGRRP